MCNNTSCDFACDPGFSRSAGACLDVDECLTGNGGCSANATCANTDGARTCTCRGGYAGDGVTCTDVNECLILNGGCSLNATCSNTPGSRSCVCNAGYEGNGLSCTTACCTDAGVCTSNPTPARCGAGGGTCVSCATGNICLSGFCAPCTGCIDTITGACQTGMTNALCGKMGGFCQVCDQSAGQTCQGGTCFGGTTCNAATCMGCCDGNNCRLPAAFTNALCGQGSFGAACTPCLGGATCDKFDAGVCAGGRDAGQNSFCDNLSQCRTGQCCDFLSGTLGLCTDLGATCSFTSANQTCIATSCTCGGSGVCGP